MLSHAEGLSGEDSFFFPNYFFGKPLKTGAFFISPGQKMSNEKIKFDALNYRTHDEKNLKLIKKSLKELGAGRSIVIDSEGEIIAGNATYKQAQELGLPVQVVETDGKRLIVVKRTDLKTQDKKRKRLALMDNSTSDKVQWDFDHIAADFDLSELPDFGIEALPDMAPVEPVEEDEAPEVSETSPRAKKGDIWQLGDHLLMCGDSSSSDDVEKLMSGEKADMVFTDPPYGVAIGDKNKMLNGIQKSGHCTENIANDNISLSDLYSLLVKAMTNCRESCKDSAVYYVTSPQGGELGLMMMMMKEAGLPVRHILMWEKNNATFSLGRLDYDYQHEPIFYTWTKKHKNYRKGEFRTTVWKYDKPHKSDLHPTMKPVALVANCLRDGSLENDIVLDLFGGSGTTLIACEQLSRKARLMEIDPHYCDVIITRWETLTGKQAQLL